MATPDTRDPFANVAFPRAILFDAGNTLVFLDRGRVRAALAERSIHVDRQRMVQAERQARRALVRSVLPGHVGTEPHLWRRYFLALLRGSGVSLARMPRAVEAVRTLHREAHLWTHPGEGVVEALEDLLDRDVRLGVISNADGRMEDAIRSAGLRSHVEFVLDSGTVGVEKPDARIFHDGCARFGLRPDECAYVGDLYSVDVVGATEAGLRGILLDPFGDQDVDGPKVETLSELSGSLRASRAPLEEVV